ncbi:MAG: tRNA-binding protein [Methanobacterium sp.]|jgi:predicted RNA-binding protein with EMAP domain|nr:tRNA-binding protein [Methanobacterium sp.]
MWDTSKDYRLIVAQKSVELFLRTIEGANLRGKWNKKKAVTSARNMIPEIQSLYYSYLNPAELAQSPQLNLLEKGCQDIIDALGGDNWHHQFMELVGRVEKEKLEEAIAKIKFFTNTISGLRRRLELGEINDPIIGIDILTGLVSSVGKHTRSDKLLVCNVNIGRAITVITNDLTVKDGNKVAIAMLPPAVFLGITSEGMFLGGDQGVLKEVTGELGGLPHGIPLEALNESRNFVESFIK